MEVVEQVTSRDETIVKTGLIGIVTNAILAAIKAVVGFASGSIAIVLDAVNNLSDAVLDSAVAKWGRFVRIFAG